MKRTPLYEAHLALGARMVDFAGWRMPLQYSSILEEHRSVRQKAGLFDVSHMGRLLIKGTGAFPLLQKLLVSDVARLKASHAQYTLLCREDGGILDDAILYYLGEDEFLLVCNAANRETVLDWMKGHKTREGVFIEDKTEATAMIALQGPEAAEILARLLDKDKSVDMPPFCFKTDSIKGMKSFLSRTGYTGEDGFEIVVAGEKGRQIWDELVRLGARPCGLGARDTLRLEACLPLHGQDIHPGVNPIEAGLGWVVKLDKGPFIGYEAIKQAKEKGPEKRLVALIPLDQGIPRAGYPILKDREKVGVVTSGTFSPTLEKGIGLGYVMTTLATTGTELEIEARGKMLKARIVSKPFYKRSTDGKGALAAT